MGMTDYSAASSNANDALETAADGLIEEYEIRSNGRRVKRGRVHDQVQSAAILEGLAVRRARGGIFNVAKVKNPR